MSQQRGPRRSASHGAISSSYAVQACNTFDPGHHLPPFRPLRSIREHTFLDPAASVDGMLRKTTETGNIGIFSINSTRPHHHQHYKVNVLRARASLNDLRPPPRPFSRCSDRPSGRDDRKQLPSYRDSTSEIISMYGSENQSSKSLSSSLTTPGDDQGQRSYSMTMHGPRGHFAPHQVSGQQPQESHQGGGQRPRSPYPYPTRLPRHGIRPASPALTENGAIDYSRMVEINRVSHRTTHHPHKTLFPCKTARNPLPLALRQDANHSARSFSDDRIANRVCPPRSQYRPPLPSHLHELGAGPRETLESGSSEQSTRTMSLTSMSNAFGRAPTAPRLASAPRKPIFYDYSEDFEPTAQPPHVETLAPIPKRSSKPCRPDGSEEDSGTNTGSIDEGQNDVVAHLQKAVTTEPFEASRCHATEQARPISPTSQTANFLLQSMECEISRHASSLCPSSAQTTHAGLGTIPPKLYGGGQEDREVTVMEDSNLVKTAAGTRSDVLFPESEGTHEPETPACDAEEASVRDICFNGTDIDVCQNHQATQMATLDANSLEQPMEHMASADPTLSGSPIRVVVEGASTHPQMCSDRGRDSRFYSLGSGLSDLASFVKNVDMYFQSPGQESHEDPGNISKRTQRCDDEQNMGISAPSSTENGTCPRVNSLRLQRQVVDNQLYPPRTSSLRHGTGIEAGLTTSVQVDGPQQCHVVSTRSGAPLVPQPISPAKLLRLKNSIPQLMKALPPLPGYAPSPESPFGPAVVPMEFEPFEISRLTDARSTLIDAFLPEEGGEAAGASYGPLVLDRELRKPPLKLKHAASFSAERSGAGGAKRGHVGEAHQAFRNAAGRRPATATDCSATRVKRRLPIQISRPTLPTVDPDVPGTVKRRLGLQKSSAMSQLASSEPIDLFNVPIASRAATRSTESLRTKFLSPEAQMQTGASAVPILTAPLARTQKVGINEETGGTSLDGHLNITQLPRAGPEAACEGEMQSFFSENSLVKQDGGFKKRISKLKSRLADSRHHHRPLLRSNSRSSSRQGTSSPFVAEMQSSSDSWKQVLLPTNERKAQQRAGSSRKVRSKLERFMRGAKHKLWSWGRLKRRID